MSRLTPNECTNILRLLSEGMKCRDVANLYNVGVATIHRLKKRFAVTGNINYRYGGGPIKKISVRAERSLIRETRRKRNYSSRMLNENMRRHTGIQVSNRTIRRKLNQNNLR